VQGAHASPTDRVRSNIEVCSKLQRFGPIRDLVQRVIVNIPERWMEEAGAHVARCLDHGGDPRRIAEWRNILCLANVGAKVQHDSAQLAG
jgi:hypothetical protein